MNEAQRYKLIFWHSFLEDIAIIKKWLKKKFPEHKIDYAHICKKIDYYSKIKQKKPQHRYYPWTFLLKDKTGGNRIIIYSYEFKNGRANVKYERNSWSRFI